MDQWAEQTSLRLLDLITCTADGSVDSAVGNRVEHGTPRSAQVLRGLGAVDDSFRAWLESRAQGSLELFEESLREHASSSEAALESQWMVWLAETPLPSASTDSLDGAEFPLRKSAEGLRGGDESLRCRLVRLVVATARMALQSKRGARVAELSSAESAHAELARRLAYDMAYGLSHELNNPLANIASRARVLAEEEPSARKRQLLSSIVDQAMRGCEMIADLMFVARPPVLACEAIDLLGLARELVEQARPWVTVRGLALQFDGPSGWAGDRPLIVAGDRAAAREAIWALVRNAIEAADQRIIISLAIEPAMAGGRPANGPTGESTEAEARVTSMAVLAIRDDGAGLSELARQHAFNPYFSGREAGRGLGLGLAKADRLARLAGGYVSIDNLSDGGCMARIALPCT